MCIHQDVRHRLRLIRFVAVDENMKELQGTFGVAEDAALLESISSQSVRLCRLTDALAQQSAAVHLAPPPSASATATATAPTPRRPSTAPPASPRRAALAAQTGDAAQTSDAAQAGETADAAQIGGDAAQIGGDAAQIGGDQSSHISWRAPAHVRSLRLGT